MQHQCCRLQPGAAAVAAGASGKSPSQSQGCWHAVCLTVMHVVPITQGLHACRLQPTTLLQRDRMAAYVWHRLRASRHFPVPYPPLPFSPSSPHPPSPASVPALHSHLAWVHHPVCRTYRYLQQSLPDYTACNVTNSDFALQGALPYFSILCEAVVSWRQIRDPGLLNEMASVMQLYKSSLSSAGQWDAAKASLPPPVLEKLQQTYSV